METKYPPYRKIARAIISLERKTRDYELLYIGFDGAVLGVLMDYLRYAQDMNNYMFRIDDVIQASSKTKLIDRERFYEKLNYGADNKIPVCAIDMRTVSGELGETLKHEVGEWASENGDVKFKYAVCFDKNRKADIRGSRKELSDTERPKWVSSPEIAKRFLYNEDGKFYYNITPSDIGDFAHVSNIESAIAIEINKKLNAISNRKYGKISKKYGI